MGSSALTAFRISKGLTSAGLAEFLGKPKPTVHRWESGARKIGRKTLSDVAAKTGIPARVLRPDLAELMNEAAE